MAESRIDLGKLTIVDYALGAAFAFMGVAIVSGFGALFGMAIPGWLASMGGAAIGVAAWFYYLKRKADDDAR